jgi:two-component system sensor histidine kinase YesM
MNIKGWYKNLNNLSIVKKQALSFIIPVLFAVVLLGGYSFVKTREFSLKQTEDHMDSVLSQVKAGLDYKLNQYNRSIALLYLNTVLQDILFKEYYTSIEQGRATGKVLSYLEPIKETFPEVEGLMLYTDNPTLLPVRNDITGVANAESTDWVEDIKYRFDYTVWAITTKETQVDNIIQYEPQLSIIRRLRNYQISSFDANFLGYIKVDFDIDEFFHNVNQLSQGWDEWVNITDQEGNVLYNSMPDEDDEFMNSLRELKEDPSVSNLVQYKNHNYMIKTIHTDQNNWTIFYAVSMDFYANNYSHLYFELTLIILVFIILSLMLSIYLAKKQTARIVKLDIAVRQVETGNLNIEVETDSNDEIGRLTRGFNDMVKRINFLIHQVYQFRIKEKEFDLQALQAQLNPHFLYNTLSAISWMGRRHKIMEIPEISEALARFYRLTLNNGNNIISIEEEMEQARAYLDIKKIRYGNRLSYLLEVDDNLKKHKTIKLILQPFIENSIIHGMYNEERELTIIVRAYFIEDYVELSIIDNGMGISEEKLKTLLDKEAPEQKGYGISNVDKRIKMYFGESFGVSFSSTVGVGTSVTLKIPIILKDDEIMNYSNNQQSYSDENAR